jgi:hypothetical protein
VQDVEPFVEAGEGRLEVKLATPHGYRPVRASSTVA